MSALPSDIYTAQQRKADAQAIAVESYRALFDAARSDAERKTLALDITPAEHAVIVRFDRDLARTLSALRRSDIAEEPEEAIRRVLATALSGNGRGAETPDDPTTVEAQAPRWPSTLEEVDRVAGGFYGVTVIAGETGVGKSSLAFSSAIEAARAGWTVAYCNSELDAGTVRYYLKRRLPWKAHLNDVLRRLRIVNVGPGVTLPQVSHEIFAALDWDYRSPERLLIVLDSVNTIAELAQGGEGVETYFSELRRWLLWAMECRRKSGGLISVIAVSETNAKGETKGRKADYVADMVLHMHRGDTDGYVKVAVVKGRYSGRQDLGAMFFDWRTGEFKGQYQLEGSAHDEPI